MADARRTRQHSLPRRFPKRALFQRLVDAYASRPSYWYVPKARVLNDANIELMRRQLALIDSEFTDSTWNLDAQNQLLDRMIETDAAHPNRKTATLSDRTALSRIIKQNLETFGLLWVQNDQTLLLTSAGHALVTADGPNDRRAVIERQVRKFQYPNPLTSKRYQESFDGLLPHRFLLQLLLRLDGELSFDEYLYLVNLAQSQADLAQVAEWIRAWRGLAERDRGRLKAVLDRVPMAVGAVSQQASRTIRVSNNASYSRAFFGFPRPIAVDQSAETISLDLDAVDRATLESSGDPPITKFETKADWFAYFGDPDQEPSWFTDVIYRVSTASSEEDAKEAVRAAPKLTRAERSAAERRQIEKAIELSYAAHPDLLHTLEPGLMFEDRQISTPIGQIDLLCKGADGKYVVVEIKVGDAEDAVFGQILRYMGWIHRNFEDGEQNVRGIILAGGFTDKARYSRIGLLRDDAEEFLGFRTHAFATEAS